MSKLSNELLEQLKVNCGFIREEGDKLVIDNQLYNVMHAGVFGMVSNFKEHVTGSVMECIGDKQLITDLQNAAADPKVTPVELAPLGKRCVNYWNSTIDKQTHTIFDYVFKDLIESIDTEKIYDTIHNIHDILCNVCDGMDWRTMTMLRLQQKSLCELYAILETLKTGMSASVPSTTRLEDMGKRSFTQLTDKLSPEDVETVIDAISDSTNLDDVNLSRIRHADGAAPCTEALADLVMQRYSGLMDSYKERYGRGPETEEERVERLSKESLDRAKAMIPSLFEDEGDDDIDSIPVVQPQPVAEDKPKFVPPSHAIKQPVYTTTVEDGFLVVETFNDVERYCQEAHMTLDDFTMPIWVKSLDNEVWIEVAARCKHFDAATMLKRGD